METATVEVHLPRFTMTWGSDLRSVLQSLGMGHAFTRTEADFSGINGVQPPDERSLQIDGVFHTAFVKVDEEGTEAAAFSSARMLVQGPPPRFAEFRADHPFLFAIRDRATGAILFLGRVMDPTKEKG
jgi:serpin B